MTNSQISSKWQPEKSALPTLSLLSLANTIKRHLDFLPNDDSYNIHLKSLIVSSRGETSGVKLPYELHEAISYTTHAYSAYTPELADRELPRSAHYLQGI